jgi:thioredoxin-dependent peroxiredoxin
MSQAAPFSLHDQTGQTHTLAQYSGKWLVLYFYPKDDTPGCTREACDFRDNIGNLRELGAEVIGISADSSSSHEKFQSKYGLNFPLLVDEGNIISRVYGAYGTKNLYGKISEGIIRQTFLIDPKGEIVKHWKRVSVDGHVAAVEKELKAAQAK